MNHFKNYFINIIIMNHNKNYIVMNVIAIITNIAESIIKIIINNNKIMINLNENYNINYNIY